MCFMDLKPSGAPHVSAYHAHSATPTSLLVGLVLGAVTVAVHAQTQAAPPAEPFTEVERGPHHKKWVQLSWETGHNGVTIAHTNSYLELATGMHYQKDGQWLESRPDFQVTKAGYAVSQEGQHQVIVSPNLNTPGGVVDLQMPDGRRLRSALLGLNLFDSVSGKTLQIAAVKDSTGQQTAPNEITFFDAFDGLKANVRIRNERGGFHQEVLLNERLSPDQVAALGFNDPKNVRLEIWTEFLEAPTPGVRSTLVKEQTNSVVGTGMLGPAAEDDFLDFGSMLMPRGRAFVEAEIRKPVSVLKEWFH
jgi:hypothetical protein